MMPIPTLFSLRASVQLSCILVAAAGLIRLLATSDHFVWLIVAQAVNGIPGPLLMNLPPLLSATWFPSEERVLATSIGYTAQNIGIAIAFLLCPFVVQDASDIPTLNKVQAGLSVALLVIAAVFPSQPALAPSSSAARPKHQFWAGLRVLACHRQFICLACLATLMTGLPSAFQQLLDNYLDDYFTDEQVGWMGFWSTIGGTCACVISGIVIDRWQLSIRGTVGLCSALTAAALGAFLWEVFIVTTPRFWPCLSIVVAVGSATGPLGALLCEWGADITYPVSEETSATILCLGYAACSITAMGVGGVVRGTVMIGGCAALMGTGAFASLWVSEVSLRKDLDLSNTVPTTDKEDP